MSQKDSWSPTSGLLDDYDLTITEAWFGVNAEYSARAGTDRVMLNLQGPATVDGEIVDPEHTEMYSLGNGWAVAGGGASAEHPKLSSPNQNSSFGRLLVFLSKLDGFDKLRARGSALDAETWIGVTLHLERQTVSKFRDKATGDMVEVNMQVPTAIVSVEDGAAVKEPVKAKPGLRKAVLAFASRFDDYESFLDAVLDDGEFPRAEEIAADESLYAEVLDEAGIFAEAHK